MIRFLIQGRVRIKIRIRMGLCLTLAFIIGAIVPRGGGGGTSIIDGGGDVPLDRV